MSGLIEMRQMTLFLCRLFAWRMLFAGCLISEEFLVIWCSLEVFQDYFSLNGDKRFSSSKDRRSERTCQIVEMVKCRRDLEGNLVLNSGKPVEALKSSDNGESSTTVGKLFY